MVSHLPLFNRTVKKFTVRDPSLGPARYQNKTPIYAPPPKKKKKKKA